MNRTATPTPVRHLASSFAYDEDETAGDRREPTLLGSADIVAKALERELQVSNPTIVRCAESGVQPVINTGTLCG